MATATIVIEDVEGAIALRADFGDGFDPDSHAHQHAHLLIGMMDQLAERQQTTTEEAA